jgi:membrane-bound inhibitor of C-type lysozyme
MPITKTTGYFSLFAVLCAATVFLSACSEPEPTPAAQIEAQAPVTKQVASEAQSTESKQTEATSHSVTEHLFRCTDGEEFSIRFGDQMATLNTANEQFDLRQQPAGSGVRYADETVEFLSKGDQAIFMIADQTHDCTLASSEQQQIPGPETTAAKP